MEKPSNTSGAVHHDTLSYQRDGGEVTVQVGASTWYAWLETATSFTFRSDEGTFTAHKARASNRRGGWYWCAYRRRHGHLSRFYLGTSAKLTVHRLREAARQLAARSEDASSGQEAPLHVTHTASSSGTSDAPLLVTKMHIPRLPVQHVPRPHLVELLDRGVQNALTLVSAPAGSGKTTLLAEWATTTALPVAWLSLEYADNDPVRFLSYLIAALGRLDARIGGEALTLLRVSRSLGLERMLTSLVNDLASYLVGDAVLILDDAHLITSEAVHAALQFLLDHVPAHLHLLIGTRADPPLSLARLRARGQLSEIRTGELRFASAEVHAFVQEMGLTLTGDALSRLEQRTEGWIAGVQLLVLALRGRADPVAFLGTFPGSHRFLLDYMSEEVLAQQSPEVRTFLLRTSLLERLCGSLCDAVTGQSGGQEILAELRQVNLFVSALDEVETWYHYHPLFAEVLRSHLQRREPDLVPEIYRRASAWYEQQPGPVEACDYALLARDYLRAAALMEPLARTLVERGEFTLLRRWLDLLPPEVVATRPQLGMASAWVLLFDGELERVEALVDQLERYLQEHEQEADAAAWAELRGELHMFSALMALPQNDSSRTIKLARKTLQSLPGDSPYLRRLTSLSLGVALGTAYRASGDLAAAEQMLTEASVPGPAAEYHFLNLIAMHDLAELYEAQGQLHKWVASMNASCRCSPATPAGRHCCSS